MKSQYASLRSHLGDNDWTVEIVSGGHLTGSSSMSLAIQSHNRVGLNLVSTVKNISYTHGETIKVTIHSTAIASGEDVFKFVLSARNSDGTLEQIAEYFVKELDQVTYRAEPWVISLSEPAHIAMETAKTIASTNDFPTGSNRIQGQLRKVGDITYRYDQFSDFGEIEATPGYWLEDARAGFVSIAETDDDFGCDRSTQQVTSLTYGVSLNPATTLISQPIKYWWANRTSNVAEAGQVLTLQILINNSATTNGVSNNVLFDTSINVVLLGYVELATGVLDTTKQGVGIPIIWRPNTNQIVLKDDIEPGFAACYSIVFDFSVSSLADLLTQGAGVALNLIERRLAAIYNPVGLVTGDCILPESDRLRFLPTQIMAGTALIEGYQIQYFAPADIINALAPNTPNQKVVISTRTTSIARIGDPGTTEAIRAIVSTEAGCTPIKWLKNSDARDKFLVDNSIVVEPYSNNFQPDSPLAFALVETATIHLEFNQFVTPTTVRADYPDNIAEMTVEGTLENLYIIVYEYQEDIAYVFQYNSLNQLDGFGVFNNPALSGVSLSTLTEQTDSDYGLFSLPEVIAYFNNDGDTGGITLPAGFYRVGLTYKYDTNNTYPTKISHSPTKGCLPELSTSLVDSIFDKNKWLAPVADINTLKGLTSNTISSGTIIFVIGKSSFYWFDALSEEKEDDDKYIELADNTGPGRFIKVGGGSDALDEFEWTEKGEIIVYDGASAIALPAPELNQVLMGDPTTDTGLKWDTLSGAGSGDGDFVVTDNQFMTEFLSWSEQKYPRREDYNENAWGNVITMRVGLENPDDPDNSPTVWWFEESTVFFGSGHNPESTDSIRGKILIGGDGFPITAIDRDPEISATKQSRVLLDYTFTTPEENFVITVKDTYPWVDFSFTSLNDTYNPEVTIAQQGAFLRYDATSSIWVPADPEPIPSLTQLPDTFLPNPLNGQALVWDSVTKKFIASLPVLTSIAGLEYETNSVVIPGDAQWNNTVFLLSARQPNTDLKETFPSLTFNEVRVTSDSPYQNGSFSYSFDQNSNKYITIPTNATTLFSADIFALEFWFKATELQSGQAYALVGRYASSSEFDFSIDIREVSTPNLFEIDLEGQNNTGGSFGLQTNDTFRINKGLPGFSGVQVNTWHHLAVTRNGSDLRLFVDGILYDSISMGINSFKFDFVSQANIFMCFGRLNATNTTTINNFAFIGLMEDIRLTKGHARYIANFTPPSEPLPITSGGSRDEFNYSITFSGLVDVDESITPLEDYVPAWSETKGKYVPKQIGASGAPISLSLGQISDVDLTNASVGELLGKIDANTWGSVAIGTGVTSFNGESGVVNVTSDHIPQGLTNLYLNDGAIASKLGTSNLEALGNVANTIANQSFLYKNSEGVWSGATVPYPVASVNSKTGTIVLTTLDINENTNLYYTDARVSTLLATLPLNTFADVSYAAPSDNQALLWNTNQFVATTLTTDLVSEGTKLYHTNTRVDDRIALASITSLTGLFADTGTLGQTVQLDANGLLAFVDFPTGGGADLASSTTDDLGEGSTNLYYTDTRVDNRLSSRAIADLAGVFTALGTTGQTVRFTAGGLLEPVDFPTGGTPDLSLSTTDDLSEGSVNLYYTDTRVDARITAANVLTDLTSFDTDDLSEGSTNLYYTDTRVDNRLSSRAIADLSGVFTGTPTEGQVATVDDTGKLTFFNLQVPKQLFKAISGSYTLLEGDHGYILKISNDCTLTLPTGLSDGYQVTILLITENTITLSTAGTLLSKGAILSNQYGAVYLTHETSNTWIALGDLDE